MSEFRWDDKSRKDEASMVGLVDSALDGDESAVKQIKSAGQVGQLARFILVTRAAERGLATYAGGTIRCSDSGGPSACHYEHLAEFAGIAARVVVR